MERYLEETSSQSWKQPFSAFHLDLRAISLSKIQRFVNKFGISCLSLSLEGRYAPSSGQAGNEQVPKIRALFNGSPNMEKLQVWTSFEQQVLQKSEQELPRVKHLVIHVNDRFRGDNWSLHYSFPNLKILYLDEFPPALFIQYMLSSLPQLEEITLGNKGATRGKLCEEGEEDKLWSLYTQEEQGKWTRMQYLIYSMKTEW